MKTNTAACNRGKANPKVPFFCHPIVACLDLVLKTTQKTRLPSAVNLEGELAAQLCFDLALSIRDRIDENAQRMGPILRACERAEWEKRSPIVGDAYQALDRADQAEKQAHIAEDKGRLGMRMLRSDSDLRRDAEFVRLWELVSVGRPLDKTKDLAETFDRSATKNRSVRIREFISAQDRLSAAKQNASSVHRVAVADVVRRMAIDRLPEVFDFSIQRMMEISDASPRLALGNDSGWIAGFWERTAKLAQDPREFPPETFLLRDMKAGQIVLDDEMRLALSEKRKANRTQAFYEWALVKGVRYGISPRGFKYHAAFQTCRRQDIRVGGWTKATVEKDLVQYLAQDKTEQFTKLEAVLRATQLRQDNPFSVMAEKIGDPSKRFVSFGDTIGTVFKDKAEVLARMQRYLSIEVEA